MQYTLEISPNARQSSGFRIDPKSNFHEFVKVGPLYYFQHEYQILTLYDVPTSLESIQYTH